MSCAQEQYDCQYRDMIDEQTWEFIRRTDQWYPPDTIDLTLQRQRANYNAMCREFHTGYPPGIAATDDVIRSTDYDIPIRRYTSSNKNNSALVVYFHGGGFIVGGLESHDSVCADICAATRLDVTAIDYRLAPEHLHPAAFEDSLAGVQHEYTRSNTPVVLCGDSAGGNLAAAISHHLRDSKSIITIAGQVLIYPALGGDNSCGSYVTHANAPLLSTREVSAYEAIRTGTEDLVSATTIAPLKDKVFTGLPPTVVFSAQCDPLADDGLNYAAAINETGGNACCILEDGLVHGYLRARHTVDRAAQSFNRIIESIIRVAA